MSKALVYRSPAKARTKCFFGLVALAVVQRNGLSLRKLSASWSYGKFHGFLMEVNVRFVDAK